MSNLQSVSIIAAFPIGIVITLIVVSFLKDIKKYTEKSKIEKGIIVGGEKAISEKVFNLIKSYIKR